MTPGLCSFYPSTTPENVMDGSPLMAARSGGKCWIHRVFLKGDSLEKYTTGRRKGMKPSNLAKLCTLPGLKVGEKARRQMDSDPRECVPKLTTVAEDILKANTKTAVFLDRQGIHVLRSILKTQAASRKAPLGIATIEHLAAFNAPTNLHGEELLVILLDVAVSIE